MAEARIGADGTPADLVVVLDDLELNNLDQPDVVCVHFRAALESGLAALQMSQTAEQRLRTRLRTTCAFHLMAPMVEAYFFGDHAALVRAGCAPNVAPELFDPDVEHFESNDPAWRPAWEADNQSKEQHLPWWRAECHPKHYLEFLVEQHDDDLYEEVSGGVEAFKQLNWPEVPAYATAMGFARSMFEDISDFLGVPNPVPGISAALTYPNRRINRSKLQLRNM